MYQRRKLRVKLQITLFDASVASELWNLCLMQQQHLLQQWASTTSLFQEHREGSRLEYVHVRVHRHPEPVHQSDFISCLSLGAKESVHPPPDSKGKIKWWREVPQRSSIQRRRAWKHWASPSSVHIRGWAMPEPWCFSLQVQGRAQLCGHLLDMDVGKSGGWRQGGAGMPELLRGAPLFHTRTFGSCIQICKYLYFLSCSNRHLLGDPCSIFHLLHALAEALGYLLWLRLV